MTRQAATLSHVPIRIDRLTVVFFFFLTLAVSRGVLQLTLGKKLAMLAQFGGLVGLGTAMFASYPFQFRSKQKWLLILSLLFIAESFVSCMLTLAKNDSLIWVIYVMFNCGLLWLALMMVRDYKPTELAISVAPIILFIGWLLLGVALLEQLKLIKMTGSGKMFIVRPASLMGSFLHYPIVMAMIGLLCIQWYTLKKKIFYLFSGIVFCLSPFAAVSRSGALIVLAALFFYPFFIPFKKAKKGFLLLGFFIVLLAATFFFFSKEDQSSLAHNLIYRVVSSVNTKSAGNNIRVVIWKKVTSEWLGTNLLIGEEAGEYTNSSNNIKAKKKMNMDASKVTESSPLQLLLNFGLIGMVLFYGILFQVPRFIAREHFWIHAAFLGAIVQTFVYQSIEVVPFIVLLFLLPWISQCFQHRSSKNRLDGGPRLHETT